jgi:L,D-transpeptidase-like protein
LHAGNLPGYPASHGCVRLPKSFSKVLFSVTQLGTPVIIADQDAAQSSVVRPDLILPKDVTDVAQEAEAKKASSRKLTADVKRASVTSILVSGGDRKAYLIVDGVVTFETPINVINPGRSMGTHLFSLIGQFPDG